ncbi:MAG: indole-3-glycerol phosphate synthase TrpC [Acidimicrobiia bacterium]
MSILEQIIEAKTAEVATLDRVEIADGLATAPPTRGFVEALRASQPPAVIAEFKRASPSRGEIRPGAEPAAIARQYEAAGAAALSVLTDSEFFGGSLEDLIAARAATDLPVLRKDFIIDQLQVTEARCAGADAVLLIVAALDNRGLHNLIGATEELDMDALVEVHDEEEARRALAVGATLLGINNRDLRTFQTDPGVTKRLAPLLDGCTIVSESGINDPAVIEDLIAAGATAFLIGEALMVAADPDTELERLRGRP